MTYLHISGWNSLSLSQNFIDNSFDIKRNQEIWTWWLFKIPYLCPKPQWAYGKALDGTQWAKPPEAPRYISTCLPPLSLSLSHVDACTYTPLIESKWYTYFVLAILSMFQSQVVSISLKHLYRPNKTILFLNQHLFIFIHDEPDTPILCMHKTKNTVIFL